MNLENTLVELRQKENKTEQEIQLTAWLEELQMRRELMDFMVKDFENYKEACIQCQKMREREKFGFSDKKDD